MLVRNVAEIFEVFSLGFSMGSVVGTEVGYSGGISVGGVTCKH